MELMVDAGGSDAFWPHGYKWAFQLGLAPDAERELIRKASASIEKTTGARPQGWLSRYLHVFLWLPVANIFGSLLAQIQQEMIKLDIAQLGSSGQTSFGNRSASSDSRGFRSYPTSGRLRE